VTSDDIESLAWEKGQGLLPAIIQDSGTGTVLMTGYVNPEALRLMLERSEVVLYSRTRKRLWVKGETSGNRISVERVVTDCDRDAVLVLGRPSGPVCHTGARTCFQETEAEASSLAFLATLEQVVAERVDTPRAGSYTAMLAASGTKRIAQKVAEEGLEVALAASSPEKELLAEAADLIFHLIVLLKTRRLTLAQVTDVLQARHAERTEATHPDLDPGISNQRIAEEIGPHEHCGES
jgi:phosphoribosyl-AMP cyclohydrolase / phosphoribosyl-ATP pyrophosphohydrolase